MGHHRKMIIDIIQKISSWVGNLAEQGNEGSQHSVLEEKDWL